MDIFAFIYTSDPTKVRIVERERNEGEVRLLDTTIGRTVPLYPVAPDRADSELKASVERLFDEGGSGDQTEQGDSTGGEPNANIQLVVKAADIAVKNVAPVVSRRKGKRKSAIMDAGGASHPPKKLRKDHETPSGTSIDGKSRSTLHRLLAGAVLNVKVGVAAIHTLPSVTASVSTTPEREGRDHIDSVTEPNLHTVGASRRFFISLDSSHHSSTNVAEAEVDSLVAKEKLVEPSPFGAGSSSAGGTDPTAGVFSYLTSSDFLVAAICTVINPDTDLQKVYIPQWSLKNGSRLDDGRVCREMVDEFAPPKFLASVRMHAEYIVKEKIRLKSVVERHDELLNVREEEIEKKSPGDETNALRERNVILEKEQNALDVKVTELETSVMSKEPIGKAIEKGMQDGRAIGITHGKKGRVLTDVAAYNPSVEVDYIFDLQQLHNVNFSLLARLKSNKDASVETVMDILRLEGPLAKKLELNEL
nr:hypothetical protein [Tanacetum cinerariifolium]